MQIERLLFLSSLTTVAIARGKLFEYGLIYKKRREFSMRVK